MDKIEDDNTSIFIENVEGHSKMSRFQMVTSPEAFFRIATARSTHEGRNKSTPFQLGSLLDSKRGPSIKKISQHRSNYRLIKQKIAKTLSAMQSAKKDVSAAEVVVWKQEVLASFMGEYLCELQKECKEKADILLFIWNSVFNIIEWLFEAIGRLSKREEKDYLNNLLDNHKSYQSVIENLSLKLAKKEQESARQEEFIKALVYNLRFKRKEIKKLSKNLKVCTFQLNEIKDLYLDLQAEHIDLLSQDRDISKENAKNLVKRKLEINHEKRKEFKIKQSHKKIRFQIQNEIVNQNANESENVGKLNQELHLTFHKYYEINKSTGEKINYPSAQNIFENALDDFNVRIQQVPETESLIDFKTNINFVDAQTDMAGFQLDIDEKATQITLNDRLFEDMVQHSHAAVQTQQAKPKQKVFQDRAQQVNSQDMKSLAFTRVRVYDRSYLLYDYRDKRNRNERGAAVRLGQERTDSREVHYEQTRLKSKGFIKYRDSKELTCDSAVQTEGVSFMLAHAIPTDMRNLKLEKEIEKYFQKLNGLLRERAKEEQSPSPSLRRALQKKNSSKVRSLVQSESQSSLDLDPHRPSYELLRKQKIKIASSRSKHRIQIHSSESRFNQQLDREQAPNEKKMQSIEQTQYEHLGSKEEGHGEVRSVSVSRRESSKKEKRWVMKPEPTSVYERKEKFLKELKKGDQLLSKTSLHNKNESYLDNKKMLAELQKLSWEIEQRSGPFDLLEETAQDNMSLLREELRKMLTKKRSNRKLALSRQQSLSRLISFVYTYAYHLYFNHKKQLQNLIIPLFHHFKIGYGEIKKNDLYLRMLYFLSQTICHQHEYYIFGSFILFLGLNITGQKQLKVCHQTTCFYLNLLHKLSVNFRFPLNVDQLYTTLEYFDQKCRQILVSQRFEEGIIEKIVECVKTKLRSVNEHQCTQEEDANQLKQTKLNVFKCCELVIQQVENFKTLISESYEGLLEYFKREGEMGCKEFVSYVLNNCYFTKQELQNKLQILEELQSNVTPAKFVSKLGKRFMQLKVPHFQKLYYIALAKYKIKQQFLYLSLNRRLNFMIDYLKKHEGQFQIERVLVDSIIGGKATPLLKQQTTKRILALAYLRIVQNQSATLISGMLGNQLQLFL